jgi:hypothetical protein
MAKKNLINADMLLATPRKIVEPTPPVEMALPEPTPIVILEPEPIIAIPEVIEEPALPVASVKRGLKGNETRATFIVDEILLEKLKAIAYWERLNIKEVINETFLNYIESYEKRNTDVKPIPKR